MRLDEVGFSYGDAGFRLTLPAWQVARGARVGVVGPSGCGKSTLLGLVAGELVPDTGAVEVAGTRIDQLDDGGRRAWRVRNVGLVFQDFPLVDYLDAVHNVVLPYRLHGALRLDAAVWDRAARLLDELGLAGKHGRLPARLSQGERQRVAIARALVTEPSLLLADEPTTGLDAANADAVMALLAQAVAARGMTLVMVTHDHRLEGRFDDVLHLSGGAP
ncbi:MAG: ATP-binding cassette domain-containing protein [Alphaproteobacteria bacterium]|nr:ATP-binding cassette domain-containing protein [Alphaproteobacteria bacterium]